MNAEAMAGGLVAAVQVYLALGGAFALAFLLFGVQRVDENASGSWAFRIVIAPGVTILWPLLLARWIGGRREAPVECNAHRAAAARKQAAFR